MADPWLLIFDIVSLLSIVLMLISIIILRLTLDRRVRKAMPIDKIYEISRVRYNLYVPLLQALGTSYAKKKISRNK